jgi:sugar transferase (PEP-CTERM system associated)
MVKLLNQYFPGRLFILLVTENLLILGGVWAVIAYQVGRRIPFTPISDPVFFTKAFLITVICQCCLYYADTYDLRYLRSRTELILRMLQAFGAAALLLAALFYLVPAARLGEGIVEFALIAILSSIVCWRVVIEWLNRAYGAGERVVLAGSSPGIVELSRVLSTRKDLPIHVCGVVTEAAQWPIDHSVKALGSLEDLESVLNEIKPKRLIIGLRERRQQLPIDLLLYHRLRGMMIEEASTMFQKITGRVPVESIHPSSLIFSDGYQQSKLRRIVSRLIDLCGAVVGLLLFGPPMLLIAAAVRLSSPGPALYRQERVGQNGKSFQVLKFRSMRINAESSSGPVWATERDPRITPIGGLLRKLRLDELPQFINVLRGEMSFVGPRPERPHFVEQLKDQVPFYDLRHSVRPGITGWAQVSYSYGASVEDSRVKLEYDLFYIKNNSLSFDCLILFQTIKIMLFGRGAR